MAARKVARSTSLTQRAYWPEPVDKPADGATLAESRGAPPTLAAAESVPKVLVGVLVLISAWLPPQAVRQRLLSSRAARRRRKRIIGEVELTNGWLIRLTIKNCRRIATHDAYYVSLPKHYCPFWKSSGMLQ